MIIVAIAGLNLLAFYATGTARAVSGLGPESAAPANAKVIAGVSLVAWLAVIMFGRLIMYNETLLDALGL